MDEEKGNEGDGNNAIFLRGSGAVMKIKHSTINFSAGTSGTPGNEQSNKVDEPNYDDKDLTWLVKGKFALYKNRVLSKMKKTVFYGRQQVLPKCWREVAVKIIESEEKKLDEVKLLMKLDHPNIVKLIDAGERTGDFVNNIYIAMELCSQSLRTYVETNPFSFEKSFSFVKQMVEGLDYLHQNNVVHYDLKPDNVLLSLCKRVIKLSDFGLSKEIPVGLSSATLTKTGAGTEGYRAPETYQNISRISPSTDVFPFGLVTHFIFTSGKHPYGNDPDEWSLNIKRNQNRDLTQIPYFDPPYAHKREQLIDILCQTLRHNSRERPTMKEMKQTAFITDVAETEKDQSRHLESIKPAKAVEIFDETVLVADKEDSKKGLQADSPSTTIEDQGTRNQITSWAVFKDNIHTGPMNFAGNEIVAETRGGFHRWKHVYKCTCRDVRTGHTVKVSGYHSSLGATEHACAKLIREMVQQGIYPKPHDFDQLAHM